jgi:hypothetical protein
MDQKQMLKQMLEFNQTTFNNAFNTMTLLQDQFERVAKTCWNKPLGCRPKDARPLRMVRKPINQLARPSNSKLTIATNRLKRPSSAKKPAGRIQTVMNLCNSELLNLVISWIYVNP